MRMRRLGIPLVVLAFLGIALVPVAPATPSATRTCFDEDAYMEQVRAEAVDHTPRSGLSGKGPIDVPDSMMPKVVEQKELVLDASSLVAQPTSGTADGIVTVRFTCVPAHDLLTLTTPAGLQSVAASTLGQEVHFYAQDLRETGTWILTNRAGEVVTQFSTPVLDLPVEVPALTTTPESPGDVSAACTKVWTDTRTVFESPSSETYTPTTNAYDPYISRYWTLKDQWYDGCGGYMNDERSIKHTWSISGASKSSQGASLYIAMVTEGGEFGTISCTCFKNYYYAKNHGVYLDQTTYTYLWSQPSAPAAYQATSGSTVTGGNDAVMDLACSFVTSRLPWWASSMICSGVKFITSPSGTGDVPYTVKHTGYTDGWNSNSPAGGIVYNFDWKSGAYETQAHLPMYKTSNADRTVYVTTFFTVGGHHCTWIGSTCSRTNAPTQTWGANTGFMNWRI